MFQFQPLDLVVLVVLLVGAFLVERAGQKWRERFCPKAPLEEGRRILNRR